MDPVRNPFAPGAGAQPPELVGRDTILDAADIAVRRAIQGRPSQSFMLLGLRGTGKTVLLNAIGTGARRHDVVIVKIEAPEAGRLPALLLPRLQAALHKLSVGEAMRESVYGAERALRSFAAIFKLEAGGVSLSVDPEVGVADSGRLDMDLSDVLERMGEAARAGQRALLLMIDEVQYLNGEELGALITALHHTNQRGLPVLFMGAGLPQVAGLAGDAKSYAERLFAYYEVGPLPPQDAARAVEDPIIEEEERIDRAALSHIVAQTEGYPYFLQEWGYQSWNIAEASPITLQDAKNAEARALTRLDAGFFKVRMDRLTPKEREYVHAMASLPGEGPYRSGDVAEKLGEPPTRLGPRRVAIIRKDMIYSPAHGDLAFTVPGFKAYLARQAVLSNPD